MLTLFLTDGIFLTVRNIFLGGNIMTENLTTKSVEELSPTEFFERVKQSKKENQDADLDRYYANALRMLEKAIKTKQDRQISLLRHHIRTIQLEKEIRDMGITTFVYSEDVENFIENVENRTVKLADLKDFPREIPDEVVPVIERVQDKFDRLVVMFTDYTDEVGQQVAKDNRDKDPILFGVFLDETSDYVMERMYFLADWEDEYCDLTLDKLIEENRELTGEEIAFYCETVNPDELLTLADNYNDKLKRTNSEYKEPEKKPPFSKVRSWLGL